MVDRFPGNAPGSRPARSVYVIEPYADFQQTFDDYQQGLRVDNLSNGWLFVPAVNRYIPPLTFGWSILLVPATRDITIKSIAAPAGIFELTTSSDGQVTIELTSYPIAEAQGTPYNSVNKNTSASTLNSPGYELQIAHFAGGSTSAVVNATLAEQVAVTGPMGPLFEQIRIKWAQFIIWQFPAPTAAIDQRRAWLRLLNPNTSDVRFYLASTMQNPVGSMVFPEPGLLYEPLPPDLDIFRWETRANTASLQYDLLIGYTGVVLPA